MTSMLTKASSLPKQRSSSQLGAPRMPQVDLLPPEVRAGRGLSQLKRLLAAGLVLVLILAGGVYGWAQLADQSANDHLAESQDEASALVRERQKYAEVPAVLKALENITAARGFGMSTEIQWRPYIDAIAAVLPVNVSIDSFNVTQAAPLAPMVLPAEPTAQMGSGSVMFSARSLTLADASLLLDALDSIPGFADPTLQSSTITEEDGTVYYVVTATIQADTSALSLRFLEEGQ
ncbi:PilN domain-containing protein [Sanguibacter suarezii]|uniref:PilN domain-containing protein n=1 Tax=Sanguibacter suarezii TaxID=60921 RepID=UPI00082FFAED|nr:hypothetical protein [Sanguibacter suarezii]